MDADTRHQLKTNELAEALSKLRSISDRQFWTGFALIAVIIAGWVGFRLWRTQQSESLSSAWTKLLTISTLSQNPSGDAVAELRQLAASNSDPALLAAVRLRLAQALIQQAGPNAASGDTNLQEAADLLRQLSQDSSAPSPLAAAAMMALAGVQEQMRRFDEARATYTVLANDARFDGLPYRELAQNRAASLDSLKTQIVFAPGESPPKPEAPSGTRLSDILNMQNLSAPATPVPDALPDAGPAPDAPPEGEAGGSPDPPGATQPGNATAP
jgi:predicted negative regulator of RcsB-dependent stress response